MSDDSQSLFDFRLFFSGCDRIFLGFNTEYLFFFLNLNFYV